WSSAAAAATSDLCREAIRLARAVAALLPAHPEAKGPLALMLLHHARRAARVVDGDWIPLDEQDTSRWDADEIREGVALLRDALAQCALRPYQIQAAISSLHIEGRIGTPRWREIASLYTTLEMLVPSPVVTLNRAVAVAAARGPEAGLRIVESLVANGGALDEYQPYHAARADLLRQLDRKEEAVDAHRRRGELTVGDGERSYRRGRLAELGALLN